MGRNPDIKIPRYNDIILLPPWHIVISGFHCSLFHIRLNWLIISKRRPIKCRVVKWKSDELASWHFCVTCPQNYLCTPSFNLIDIYWTICVLLFLCSTLFFSRLFTRLTPMCDFLRLNAFIFRNWELSKTIILNLFLRKIHISGKEEHLSCVENFFFFLACDRFL